MMNRVSTWQVGEWLDPMVTGQSWAGLFQSDPSELEPAAGEVIGSGYRRQYVLWRRTGRALVNVDPVTWRGLSVPVGLVGVGIFTSQTSSTMRASGLFLEKITLVTKTSFTLGAGEIVIAID